MLGYCLALLATAHVATAWWPHHRDMTARVSGDNLFKASMTVSHEGNETKRWLPGNIPIRGVNLGSMFVLEQWMSSTEMTSMGCGSTTTEFDCVNYLGQAKANAAFQKHWGSWITKADIQLMASYGLNTIRIPVGYWIFKNLKYSSEHFPEGQLPYLTSVCSWASDAGFYIIIDLHGAPFGQASNAFTGQRPPVPSDTNPDFYQASQYQRALWFLGNMTQYIHQHGGSTGAFRNVGMLEILNEPITSPSDLTDSMRRNYYPAAFTTIRAVESTLGISASNALHIQMMNAKWGSGDPTQYLSLTTTTTTATTHFAAYDDHRYLKWDPSVNVSQAGYLTASCRDDRGGNWPTVVGEWSLSVADAHQGDAQFWPITGSSSSSNSKSSSGSWEGGNLGFYQRWFNAQVRAYERQEGWIFWSWKTAGLGDPRWDYQLAVSAGIIPRNLSTIYDKNPCS